MAIIAIALPIAYQNCAPGAASVDGGSTVLKALENEMGEKRLQVMELAAANRVCSVDFDCVPIPIGSRACGGPSSYTFASSKSAQFAEIQALSAETEELEAELNRRANLTSICSVEIPPTLACNGGVCRISPGAQ